MGVRTVKIANRCVAMLATSATLTVPNGYFPSRIRIVPRPNMASLEPSGLKPTAVMGGIVLDQLAYGGDFRITDAPSLDRVEETWFLINVAFHVPINVQNSQAGSPAKSFTPIAVPTPLYPVNAYDVCTASRLKIRSFLPDPRKYLFFGNSATSPNFLEFTIFPSLLKLKIKEIHS